MADRTITETQQAAHEIHLTASAETIIAVQFAGDLPYNGWAAVPLTVINHSSDVFVYARLGEKAVTVANPMATMVPPNSSIQFMADGHLENPLLVHVICANDAVVSVTR